MLVRHALWICVNAATGWLESNRSRIEWVLTAYKIKNKKWMAIWLAALVLGLWPDLWPIALGLGCRHDTGTTAAKCLAAVCLAATCWPPRQRLPLPLGNPPSLGFPAPIDTFIESHGIFLLIMFFGQIHFQSKARASSQQSSRDNCVSIKSELFLH